MDLRQVLLSRFCDESVQNTAAYLHMRFGGEAGLTRYLGTLRYSESEKVVRSMTEMGAKLKASNAS